MLFGHKRNPFRLLAFRLSLTYATCCLVSLVAVLIISYVFLEGSLRRRTDSDLASEIPEYRSLLESQNAAVLEDALRQEALSEGIDQVFFRVLNREGRILFGTDTSSWHGLSIYNGEIHSALEGKIVFTDYRDSTRDFSARVVCGMVGEEMVLQLGESLSGNHTLLRQFRVVFSLATLAFVLLSLVAGVYMARRALSGFQRVTSTAIHITEGAWNLRVPVSQNQDEIDELASAFNRMVDRIQVLFRELQDVTDDIAHDLRTPLMRIRGEAEMALRESDGALQGDEHFGSVLEECDQMLHFINTMLEISQTEAGAMPVERNVIEMGDLVEDVCDLFRPAAEDKAVTLLCDVDSIHVIRGDGQRLKRALAHLVDNGIKYTPSGGSLSVTSAIEGAFLVISVADTGIGIPESAHQDVFGRFYRVEASRFEQGNGLGLSLARAIVRAHGGDIELVSVLDQGTTFKVRLPLVDS